MASNQSGLQLHTKWSYLSELLFLLLYKMLRTLTTLFVVTSALVIGQRPRFAGTRPIGFPELVNRKTTPVPGELADRFGEGTTQKLPIEANGDRDLVDRLSKLPIDEQPFWFINWQAYEVFRKNPQLYPQKPNVFVDPVPQSNSQTTSMQEFRETQESDSFKEEIPHHSQSSANHGFVNSNQGVLNNQGFSTNNQGISTYKPEFSEGQLEFLANGQEISNKNIQFSNSQGSFSSLPKALTSSQNTKRFVNSNHGLSRPNSGRTNSINGFVFTDPPLEYTNTENYSGIQNNDNVRDIPNQFFTSTSYIPSSVNSNQQFNIASYISSSGHSNQQITSVNSRPSINQQIYKIPNHGLTTIKQEFSNQNPGLVTPNVKVPNNSFSSSVTSNVAISNSKPGIDANQSTSSSSSNKVGDAHKYSYQWNNTYNNKYKYTYIYTKQPVTSVSHNPRPDHNNQGYHYLYRVAQ